MYTIKTSIEIAAPIATLKPAISTLEGFRAWLNVDAQKDAAGRYDLPFGPRRVTFALDRVDDRGVVMTCVREENNPDWLGTELTITLTPLADGKTHVALVHTGYPSKNECYERCIGAWDHCRSSLAGYATTGKGRPFDVKVAAPARAQAQAEARS